MQENIYVPYIQFCWQRRCSSFSLILIEGRSSFSHTLAKGRSSFLTRKVDTPALPKPGLTLHIFITP
jgi:hypothetical protein